MNNRPTPQHTPTSPRNHQLAPHRSRMPSCAMTPSSSSRRPLALSSPVRRRRACEVVFENQPQQSTADTVWWSLAPQPPLVRHSFTEASNTFLLARSTPRNSMSTSQTPPHQACRVRSDFRLILFLLTTAVLVLLPPLLPLFDLLLSPVVMVMVACRLIAACEEVKMVDGRGGGEVSANSDEQSTTRTMVGGEEGAKQWNIVKDNEQEEGGVLVRYKLEGRGQEIEEELIGHQQETGGVRCGVKAEEANEEEIIIVKRIEMVVVGGDRKQMKRREGWVDSLVKTFAVDSLGKTTPFAVGLSVESPARDSGDQRAEEESEERREEGEEKGQPTQGTKDEEVEAVEVVEVEDVEAVAVEDVEAVEVEEVELEAVSDQTDIMHHHEELVSEVSSAPVGTARVTERGENGDVEEGESLSVDRGAGELVAVEEEESPAGWKKGGVEEEWDYHKSTGVEGEAGVIPADNFNSPGFSDLPCLSTESIMVDDWMKLVAINDCVSSNGPMSKGCELKMTIRQKEAKIEKGWLWRLWVGGGDEWRKEERRNRTR
eukprot:GHVS01006013.1.p1 GENE.GHVS01006013.1~~GHVS01006013.1.p1  ORF type:complete len:544 (-),score=159.44 GHVS01006013.1:710-2341(-)